jgi:peptidoglycan/LPS O-acetylase OafA/YrhL
VEINVLDPGFQTAVFSIILVAAILLTSKKDKNPHEMNIDHTNQLKGIAILMVIFSHIGYFLDSNDKFLYPLSVAGGVGVNIFLFLSGFGLTISALKSHHSVLGFYWKRLSRIFLPMWLVLVIFLALDYFLLKITYSTDTITKLFLGFVPYADIYLSFNSPLWYFTLILFYYLIFPLTFWKKAPILSAAIILIISVFVLKQDLPVVPDVLKLYKLHFIAFPIGIVFAILQNSKYKLTSLIKGTNPILRYVLVIMLTVSIGYTAIHSGVGEKTSIEQSISLITMTSFILIILLIPLKSKLLMILGIYSYEIYLIQWPMLYRHDFLYKLLPAGIATAAYIVLFLIISFILKKIVDLIFTVRIPRNRQT